MPKRGELQWSPDRAIAMIASGRYTHHVAQIEGVSRPAISRWAHIYRSSEYLAARLKGYSVRLQHALQCRIVTHAWRIMNRDATSALRNAPAWLITPEFAAARLEIEQRMRKFKRNRRIQRKAKIAKELAPTNGKRIISVVHCTNHEDSHG